MGRRSPEQASFFALLFAIKACFGRDSCFDHYSVFIFLFCRIRPPSVKGTNFGSPFTTVSPRTAGFNTVDLNRLSDDGIVMNIMLMLIGGATGSTAGGMKLTTVAVLAISAHSVLHRKKTPLHLAEGSEPA